MLQDISFHPLCLVLQKRLPKAIVNQLLLFKGSRAQRCLQNVFRIG